MNHLTWPDVAGLAVLVTGFVAFAWAIAWASCPAEVPMVNAPTWVVRVCPKCGEEGEDDDQKTDG